MIFFFSGNKRMFTDLISLSDEIFGWDANYKPLRDAALEGIWKNPGRFLEVSLMNALAGYVLGYPSDGQAIRPYPHGDSKVGEVNIPRNPSSIKTESGEKSSSKQSFDERFKNFSASRHWLYSGTNTEGKSRNLHDKTFGKSSLVKSWGDRLYGLLPDEKIRNGSSKLGYVLRLMADKFPPIALFILCTLPIFFRLNQYNYRVLSLIFFAFLLNSAGTISICRCSDSVSGTL